MILVSEYYSDDGNAVAIVMKDEAKNYVVECLRMNVNRHTEEFKTLLEAETYAEDWINYE